MFVPGELYISGALQAQSSSACSCSTDEGWIRFLACLPHGWFDGRLVCSGWQSWVCQVRIQVGRKSASSHVGVRGLCSHAPDIMLSGISRGTSKVFSQNIEKILQNSPPPPKKRTPARTVPCTCSLVCKMDGQARDHCMQDLHYIY